MKFFKKKPDILESAIITKHFSESKFAFLENQKKQVCEEIDEFLKLFEPLDNNFNLSDSMQIKMFDLQKIKIAYAKFNTHLKEFCNSSLDIVVSLDNNVALRVHVEEVAHFNNMLLKIESELNENADAEKITVQCEKIKFQLNLYTEKAKEEYQDELFNKYNRIQSNIRSSCTII